MSGTPVPIAVIDSGIHAGHPHLAGVPVEGLAVEAAGAGFHLVPDDQDVHGHGTAVAAAIARQGVPVRLLGVRVLDRALRCDSAALAYAIEAAAGRGVRLINLSLATPEPGAGPRLERAVERAAAAGAWVVAAVAAAGRGWPAELDTVLGAVAREGCPPGRCLPQGARRFGAHGEARPPGGCADNRGNLAGNSLAAAHLTALAAAVLADGEVDTLEQLTREMVARFGPTETEGGHG